MDLHEILQKSKIRYDKKTSIPRTVECRVPVSPKDKPEVAALALLGDLSSTLRLSTDKNDLKFTQSKTTPTGTYIRYQQYIDGTPVVGGEVVVHIDKTSFVRRINTNHQLRESAVTAAKDAKIKAAEAEKIMRDAVGDFTIRPKGKQGTAKVYFPTTEGLKLAWLVTADTAKPPHDWCVYVDAKTGAILAKEDHIMTLNGQGMVFNPNPVVTLNDNTIREGVTPEATLNAERQIVTLRDITGPVGGHYTLIGPYCHITELAAPAIGIPNPTSPTGFNYTRTDDNFEAVNVYYHIDSLQRFIQDTLSIPDANNRPTDADPHDNSMIAAWYSPSTKDLHFSDSGPTQPDRGEDADCMCHEYGHAIQDNMIPGWGTPVPSTTRYESRAIGEGFADILAVLYNVLLGNGYQRQVVEDWIFVQNDLGSGLRGLRRVDHNKLYSAFMNGTSAFYSNSEIWSGALWDIFLGMGGSSPTVADWESPRNILLKALIASHYILTTSTSMPEAAEALMNTHEELEDQCGRHLITMIDEFHDREILECQAGSDIRLTNLWSQIDNTSIRTNESVEYGQDNWFYATITNQGTVAARSLVVTFSFRCPYATPVYPVDFRNNIISGLAEYDLDPAETRTIWARWPKEYIPAIPAGQSTIHGCILAEIYNPVDHVAPGVTSVGASNGKLRQRNNNVVDLLPDESGDFLYSISNSNVKDMEVVRLEVIRPERWPNLPVQFSHHDEYVIQGILKQTQMLASRPTVLAESLKIKPLPEEFLRCDAVMGSKEQSNTLIMKPGVRTGFSYIMKPRQRETVKVTIKAPADAKPGDTFPVKFVQSNIKGEILGGFDIDVRIVAKKAIPITKPIVLKEINRKPQ